VSYARYNPATARHARYAAGPPAASRRTAADRPAARGPAATRDPAAAGRRPAASDRSAVGRRPAIAGRLAVDRPAAIPLRFPAGLTLIAAGAILLCAVSLNTRYLDLNVLGLILLVTGLAGIRVPQRAWRWARAHSGELRSALEQVTAVPEPEAERVPLDSLLRPVASQDPATGPPGDYW
jgi:hypothetical protein